MERRTRRTASPRGSASPGVSIVEETRQVAQGKPTWGRFKVNSLFIECQPTGHSID